MGDPTVIQLSRPEVYVNHISFGGRDAVAATLSNNFIHLVDLEERKSKQVLEVARRVAGIHFDLTGSPILRAVDDSFGIHLFDIRAGSKKKSSERFPTTHHTMEPGLLGKRFRKSRNELRFFPNVDLRH